MHSSSVEISKLFKKYIRTIFWEIPMSAATVRASSLKMKIIKLLPTGFFGIQPPGVSGCTCAYLQKSSRVIQFITSHVPLLIINSSLATF